MPEVAIVMAIAVVKVDKAVAEVMVDVVMAFILCRFRIFPLSRAHGKGHQEYLNTAFALQLSLNIANEPSP